MERKLSLLILFGGASTEHEVSRVSAASVIRNTDSEKYEINTIGITKEGNWFLTSSPVASIEDGSWEKDKGNQRAYLVPDRSVGGIVVEEAKGKYRVLPVDVIFPVLHGKNGEDGTLQGLMEMAEIPFVGSGTTASAASMDKAITKDVVNRETDVNQADAYIIRKKKYDDAPDDGIRAITDHFDSVFPLFVKPANSGSSVGISKAKNEIELSSALDKAFMEDEKVIVEETVTGREIEVAVIGNREPSASKIGEIFAANEFYDYNAKYENKNSRTAVVTDLSMEKEEEIKKAALKVYEAMGCRGLARVDFVLKESGKVIFNEINTMPGFTSISMYPKLWEASGMTYSGLIDRLIELALEG